MIHDQSMRRQLFGKSFLPVEVFLRQANYPVLHHQAHLGQSLIASISHRIQAARVWAAACGRVRADTQKRLFRRELDQDPPIRAFALSIALGIQVAYPRVMLKRDCELSEDE